MKFNFIRHGALPLLLSNTLFAQKSNTGAFKLDTLQLDIIPATGIDSETQKNTGNCNYWRFGKRYCINIAGITHYF